MSAGVMVGEVCAYYGWTVDECLKMPASRFFLMLESARKLKSVEYERACYVARSAQMTMPAFQETVGFFHSLGDTGEKQLPPKPKPPEPSTKPLSGEAAKVAVMAAFAKDTRINRRVAAQPKPTGGSSG